MGQHAFLQGTLSLKHYTNQVNVDGLKTDVLYWKMLFCHVCIVLSEVCVGAWTRSWAYARALAKDREKDGERERKKETAREFSADIWVHLTERTALQAGPSPFSTKNDTWLLWLLSSPCLHTPPNQSLQQTLRQAHIPTHIHTQRHTVAHCILLRLHYPFPQDMSPPCWMTFGLVQQ